MHIGQQEWRQLQAAGTPAAHRPLYERLAAAEPDATTREEAADFLRSRLHALADTPSDLPAESA
ncbi:MAG TPA: iron-containing redox enzyme family protein, partial [Ramlibacter sp.]|nr:iron-containing redox enzyme family protein [Ramlibacter sp.]